MTCMNLYAGVVFPPRHNTRLHDCRSSRRRGTIAPGGEKGDGSSLFYVCPKMDLFYTKYKNQFISLGMFEPGGALHDCSGRRAASLAAAAAAAPRVRSQPRATAPAREALAL